MAGITTCRNCRKPTERAANYLPCNSPTLCPQCASRITDRYALDEEKLERALHVATHVDKDAIYISCARDGTQRFDQNKPNNCHDGDFVLIKETGRVEMQDCNRKSMHPVHKIDDLHTAYYRDWSAYYNMRAPNAGLSKVECATSVAKAFKGYECTCEHGLITGEYRALRVIPWNQVRNINLERKQAAWDQMAARYSVEKMERAYGPRPEAKE